MIAEKVIRRFGEALSIDGNAAKGFLQPMHPKDADINKRPLQNGVKNDETFLLITDTKVKEGDIVVYSGEAFEVCRSTEVRFMNSVSHFEAVLRSKGRAENV